MDPDFDNFIEYAEDADVYHIPIPRILVRDIDNPLEKYTDFELIQRVRFDRDTIQNILLPMIYPNGNIRNNRGSPIPPAIKLYCALRYFATGSYQRVVGDTVSISQSTMSRVITEVVETLTRHLHRFVKFPNFRGLQQNRQLFFNIAQFPGVTGCVDGTHIEIKSPGGENAEIYRNRKGWFSINVQVVAGPQCEILDVIIRWPGSAHDSRIFNGSLVRTKFVNGTLPGILLGDSAYAQNRFMYTPVANPETRAEMRYNRAHIRTRNVVERTFGIWKSRFRCLNKAIQYNTRLTMRIIAACAILHNIAIMRQRIHMEFDFPLDREMPQLPAPVNQIGHVVRAAFINRHFDRN